MPNLDNWVPGKIVVDTGIKHDATNPTFFKDAVDHYWKKRNEQRSEQEKRGKIIDHGQRSEVTGGKHLDGFAGSIKSYLIKEGVDEKSIFVDKNLELPGFFRATKRWDLLVVVDGQLRAALESKGQAGDSIGSNLNNRAEEALGSAMDFWSAFDNGLFNTKRKPWLGYLFFLEDCIEIKNRVKTAKTKFDISKEFNNASYLDRYIIFCKKMMACGIYSSTCLVLSKKEDKDKKSNYSEPDKEISAERFLLSLKSSIIDA